MFTIYTAIIIGSASVGRAFAHASDIAKARCASTTIPIINTWSQSGEKVRTIKGHHKFSDVHFYYPARLNFPVLRDITLVVKPSQYAALVGPSGCGKSTIISITERFYQIDIDKMNVNDLREHIALVSQEPSLLPDGYDTRVGRNGTQLSGYYRKYCFIQLF
ncbi:27032_t:CDS:2 [Gigaspora margarita]|uniref:27032_t:CDS:1 n=1 Tax=Gigaspora margarita TaxID=4874 RepID=A0ABN7UYZ4_GIGMA|nr:27032_t:CDS:2 [Gigaspora margarita]